MTTEREKTELLVLSEALSDLRDSWVLISMALNDHFADVPSPERDKVMEQVERELARIGEGKRLSAE